jgi:hypothetical protein
MYIVAIGWIYVVLMMSIAEQTATAGVLTFLLYGIAPVTIILYLLGTPERRRRRATAKILPETAISESTAAPDQDMPNMPASGSVNVDHRIDSLKG